MTSLPPLEEEREDTVTDRVLTQGLLLADDGKTHPQPVQSPYKATPPRRPRELSDSQELEMELREAFKNAPTMPVSSKKAVGNPQLRRMQTGMLETIDAVDEDASGFTRGEVFLILGASVFALLFVLLVYFYTRNGP